MVKNLNPGKLLKFLFWGFLLIFVITFFTKDKYKWINDIHQDIREEPVQTETQDKNIIKFMKDNYEYELTPLYNYELNGLIVHKMDYTLLSIYKSDSVFPMDICVLWGNNVGRGVYKNKSLKFSQDMRFCKFRWQGNLNFDFSGVSNNHLIVRGGEIEKKVMSLSGGDQVKIKGRLVNVEAKNTGNPGKFDPEYFSWKTSTDRNDTEAGACEVIYVEDVQILKKGNPISNFLYKWSLYWLVGVVILRVALFLTSANPINPFSQFFNGKNREDPEAI